MNNTGDNILAENANWKFSGETVKNFDKHIERSVPLYLEGHDLISKIGDFFISDNSVIYDIGMSTGTLAKKILDRNSHKKINYIGIEIEEDMCKKAEENLKTYKNVEIICEDVMNLDLKKSDLVIAYYSIQFMHPKLRQILINKIYQSLNWGGAFLMFEKTRGSDARFQDIITSLYTDFKLDNGFSIEEVFAKSKSLKGVLEPFSVQGNTDMLKRAGFQDIESVMKYISFEGFLAIK
jgi:tRNA (cmo5U34)-methyltransferase